VPRTPVLTAKLVALVVLVALVALPAVLAAGCATLQVSSFVERGADLSRFRSFDWGPREGLDTGDPRLDNNPFFENRVKSQVESTLAARGYMKLDTRSDLIVHYHARVNQRFDTGTHDLTGSCDGADCRPFVYDAGTLVIDLVDRTSNRLVWRGWADGTLDGAIDNQRWMEQRVDEAVTKILARLPPRPALQ
jgi:hypothetical protein